MVTERRVLPSHISDAAFSGNFPENYKTLETIWPMCFQKEIKQSTWMVVIPLPFSCWKLIIPRRRRRVLSAVSCLCPLCACHWSIQIFSYEADGNVSTALTYIYDSWRGTQTVQREMTRLISLFGKTQITESELLCQHFLPQFHLKLYVLSKNAHRYLSKFLTPK